MMVTRGPQSSSKDVAVKSRVQLVRQILGTSLLLSLFSGVAATASESLDKTRAPQLQIHLIESPEPVFIWRRDKCENIDIPDAPARAFRDASNEVHLVASHYLTREAIGPTLNEVRHSCAIALDSSIKDDYRLFQDHEWIASTYTTDGVIVYGLVHNEYQGNLRPQLCPSENYIRCWSNQITFVVSNDQGYSFKRPPSPGNLIAMPPYQYEGEHGSPVGYFNPTNIVKLGNFYYVLFRATQYKEQLNGVCVMRTNDLADPTSWRAWDGTGFNVKFRNPYTDSSLDDPSRHVCAPLSTGHLVDVGGLVLDEKDRVFLMVMKGAIQIEPNGRTSSGIWITTSLDLIHWADPTLLWPDPSGSSSWDGTIDAYPSLIDPTSTSRNFETTNGYPFVYFVRTDPSHRPYDRVLFRQKIEIRVNP